MDNASEQLPPLREQEKVLLVVLALQEVTNVFECNIFRFSSMIKRLKGD